MLENLVDNLGRHATAISPIFFSSRILSLKKYRHLPIAHPDDTKSILKSVKVQGVLACDCRSKELLKYLNVFNKQRPMTLSRC